MGGTLSGFEKPKEDVHYDGFVEKMAPQQGKVFAITGTTSGTGFQAAKALVQKGGKVLCLNRPSERATASLNLLKQECAEGGTVTQIDCDLQDFSSVRAAATAVKDTTKGTGLFALVNNAGVMMLPAKATKDAYEVQMQTNHLSHFLLTSLLMPELEAAAAGPLGEARVVNHSSAARNDPKTPLEAKYFQTLAEAGEDGWGNDNMDGKSQRYHQSKLANTSFTLALKAKLEERGSKVKALVAHPGGSTTSLAANSTSHGPVPLLDNKLLMSFFRAIAQGGGDGTLPVLAATVNPDAASGDFYTPSVVGVLGRMYNDCMTGPPKKLDWESRAKAEVNTTDVAGQKLLWECSEKAVGPFFQ